VTGGGSVGPGHLPLDGTEFTQGAIAAAGAANAGAGPPQIYGSYGDCMAAGNTLAQQGEAHGFHCVDVGAGPVGTPSSQWKLIIDF
jgi:hypothetical protein